MIDSIGKITLYVNNQNEARDFWTEKDGIHRAPGTADGC